MKTTTVVAALAAAFYLLLLPQVAPAQDAYFKDGLLSIPTVNVNGRYYRAEMAVVGGTNPLEFRLSSAVPLATAAPVEPAVFSNNTVIIPAISVQGAEYKVELALVNSAPMTFRLQALTKVPPATPPQGVATLDNAMLSINTFDEGVQGAFSAVGNWTTQKRPTGGSMYCNTASTSWSSFVAGSSDWQDYALEVEVKRLGAAASSTVELYSRFDSAGNGYRASIIDGKSSGMNYFPGGSFVDGKPVSMEQDVWYTLRVELVGNRLRFYVDGTLVGEYTSSLGSKGKAGIGANPGTAICIDNVRLWAINSQGPLHRDNVPGAVNPFDTVVQYAGECFYCFMRSNPLAPVDSGNGAYKPASTDTRKETIIDENFVVKAGEEVVFDNQIVRVRAGSRKNIEVYGRLTVRNSLLLWEQTEHQQVRLVVKKGGALHITNSYAFQATPYWVNWDYESGSTVVLDGFVSNAWTSLSGASSYTSRNLSTVKLTLFQDLHDATVSISDAHHVWLEVFPPAGAHTFVLPAKIAAWQDWDLNGLWPNTKATITDSYIYERDISITKNVHATVADTPSGFGLGWAINGNGGSSLLQCELRGVGDPANDKGVFYSRKRWDVGCNNSSLTVINSVLQRAWPNPFDNVHLRIFDSNLVDPRNFGNTPTLPTLLEIYNSSIDNLATYKGGKVYVENSVIRHDIEAKDAGSIVHVYNVTRRDKPAEDIPVKLVGGGQFQKMTQPGPPWR